MKRVAVVGGGIAGLAAAYELRRGGAQVTILESRDRAGGVIVTERKSGYVIEGGPDSFLTTKTGATDLIRELGLESRVIPSQSRRVYVASNGALHPLPEGMFLTVPTKMGPLMKSGLISFGGKLRMGMDLFIRRGAPIDDESLGSFVRRRLGAEALEKIAEPLMAGIYMADADELSLKSTFPRFLDLERDHRSLIKGLRKIPAGGPVSPFSSLKGGMAELVEALVKAMPDVTIRLNAVVRKIEGTTVVLDGDRVEADAVIVATPPPAAAALLPQLADALSKIATVGSATVSLGYKATDVKRELDGTGFVIPKADRRTLLACTWTSSKFAERAPEGRVLFRSFIPESKMNVSDNQLVTAVQGELRSRIGIEGEPEIAKVFRWPAANPIYRVGHEARIREIETRLKSTPGLFLTGSGYRGIGLPDGIKDARAVAKQILVT